MVTETCNEILHSNVSVLWGAADGLGSIPVGLILEEGSVEVAMSRTIHTIRAQGHKFALRHLESAKDLRVTAPLGQFNSVLLAKLIGETEDGNTVTPSASGITIPTFGWSYVGTDINGDTARLDIYHGQSVGDLAYALTQTAPAQAPLVIAAIEGASGSNNLLPKWTFGGGNVNVTVATGVVAITSGLHKVAPESGTTDIIDSLSGMADNEIVRLQIQTAWDVLTLVHLNDTLELVGDTDFDLQGITSYIDLIWDQANTKAIEFGRFDSTLQV